MKHKGSISDKGFEARNVNSRKR